MNTPIWHVLNYNYKYFYFVYLWIHCSKQIHQNLHIFQNWLCTIASKVLNLAHWNFRQSAEQALEIEKMGVLGEHFYHVREGQNSKIFSLRCRSARGRSAALRSGSKWFPPPPKGAKESPSPFIHPPMLPHRPKLLSLGGCRAQLVHSEGWRPPCKDIPDDGGRYWSEEGLSIRLPFLERSCLTT